MVSLKFNAGIRAVKKWGKKHTHMHMHTKSRISCSYCILCSLLGKVHIFKVARSVPQECLTWLVESARWVCGEWEGCKSRVRRWREQQTQEYEGAAFLPGSGNASTSLLFIWIKCCLLMLLFGSQSLSWACALTVYNVSVSMLSVITCFPPSLRWKSVGDGHCMFLVM